MSIKIFEIITSCIFIAKYLLLAWILMYIIWECIELMCLSHISYFVFRISATSQMDRRDSLGVCVDSPRGAESLQRDQAVCISTNGTPTQTASFFCLCCRFYNFLGLQPTRNKRRLPLKPILNNDFCSFWLNLFSFSRRLSSFEHQLCFTVPSCSPSAGSRVLNQLKPALVAAAKNTTFPVTLS